MAIIGKEVANVTRDSLATLGKYAAAAQAPRGLRKSMKLGEIERAMVAARGWREVEAKVAAAKRAFVVDARRRGASWDGVGWVLGVTGEAARARYGDHGQADE
jgi:hypothetical protein